MDVFLALGGVVLGWVLALASDQINQRRAARTAATLIYVELAEARGALQSAAQSEGIAPHVPSRTAWEAHGPILVRWSPTNVGMALLKAYSSTASDAAMLTFLSADREPRAAKLEATMALADMIDDSTPKGERDFIAAKLRLEVDGALTMKKAAQDYLAGIISHTLPLIDEALAALKPRTGLSR